MAVESLFFSDRDGMEKALSNPETMMFATKAEADARDKMLEFADSMREFLQHHVPELNEETADKCAIALAENRDLLKQAIKKPERLIESLDDHDNPTDNN
jgi:hypothetical protein